jgi:hypothetical protein
LKPFTDFTKQWLVLTLPRDQYCALQKFFSPFGCYICRRLQERHKKNSYIEGSVGKAGSIQNRLSSRLLSKNIKIRIYETMILPVVLYGCETWSLALREEHRLRMFENRVLRRIFGPRTDEVTGDWRNCIMRSFITCTLRQT